MAEELYADVFGVPNAGAGEFIKAVKIAKGITTGRLIPPVKSQYATGKWSLYHAVHYGYYGTNQKDPNGKPWAKPFLCIRETDPRTRMVTKECPKCTQVEGRETTKKDREAEIRGTLKGRPEADIKAEIKADPVWQEVEGWLRTHNVDRHHYINLKLASGDIVCMKIPGKGKKALDEERKVLAAKKIDPFAANAGVFFDFHRDGDLINTTYKVNVAKEEFITQDGTVAERTKTAPLTPADVKNILAKAMDLATAHGATVLTEEQIRKLVACDEDHATVDSIFGAVTPATPAEQQAVAKPAPKVVEVAKPAVVAAPVQSEDDIAEAALLAQMAALKAKKAAAAAKPIAVAVVAPPVVDAAAVDDADSFIAEFGDPG